MPLNYRTNDSANPSMTRQAPDFNALMKTAILVVESQKLETPPVAQEYFEPGVNRRLIRRSKPKTDYTLPSDMPKYSLGFVPTNQTPGANGEEPAIVKVPESVPADLMDVFAQISREQAAEQKRLEESRIDVGTRTARAFRKAVSEARREKKINGMINAGFTEQEAEKAMLALREEEAMKMARLPAAALTVEESLNEVFGKAYATNGNGNGEPTAP